MENESFKYYAFISYCHKDQKIARKLQKRLEHYHLPAALRKSNPDLPKKLSPIFRDESDLTGGLLKETLQANLDRSNYLILICSPSSAGSEYVNDEVEYFINKLGRADHIIPLIVGGVPHSGGDTECFPKAILDLPREKEILGIDLQALGMNEAFVRVIATLLRLDIDSFVSRYRKENRRKVVMFVSAIVAIIMAVIVLMPPPYDETLADNVMANALSAYNRAGEQYESLSSLVDCAINTPEDFSNQIMSYRDRISFAGMSVKIPLLFLDDMMESGKVMPSSRQPMRKEECAELISLFSNRKEEYDKFVSVLEFVMTDDFAKTYYASQYPGLFRGLLEVDADIAAMLYQIVISPHIKGKYADDSIIKRLVGSHPKQNSHLTGEDVKQSAESLAVFKGVRSKRLAELYECGAIEAYDLKNKEE